MGCSQMNSCSLPSRTSTRTATFSYRFSSPVAATFSTSLAVARPFFIAAWMCGWLGSISSSVRDSACAADAGAELAAGATGLRAWDQDAEAVHNRAEANKVRERWRMNTDSDSETIGAV